MTSQLIKKACAVKYVLELDHGPVMATTVEMVKLIRKFYDILFLAFPFRAQNGPPGKEQSAGAIDRTTTLQWDE